MSRMWNPTGKRQLDSSLRSQNSLDYHPTGKRQLDSSLRSQNSLDYHPTSKRHRLADRVRVLAGTVKWSYLEMEDHVKCRFWKLFSGSRAKCNNKECPTCYPGRSTNDTTGVPGSQTRDGRFSTLLQKIRTWPRFGSRRIRDHTSQDATKQNSFGPSPPPGRMKAASFPVKYKDLSRARFLPRFKKFESIREESNHVGESVPTSENQLPSKENDILYMNVVGAEIEAAKDASASPSVEDLDNYSYSFGSEFLFGNREDSMTKELSMPQDTLRSNSTAPPDTVSSQIPGLVVIPPAAPTTYAWNLPNTQLAPPPSSEGLDSPQGPGAWHIPLEPESPGPKPCAARAGEAVPQSRFSGVRWKARKWTSEIRPTGAKKTVWLGTYATEEEAASAYDAGIYYFGKPKNYNFNDSETYLPELNINSDERSRLIFIKTQARLIAKKRAELMRSSQGFQPGTPDTTSSGRRPAVSGEPSRPTIFPPITEEGQAWGRRPS